MQVGNAESSFVKEMTCYYVLDNGKKSVDECDNSIAPTIIIISSESTRGRTLIMQWHV